jgi:hypothetical protein
MDNGVLHKRALPEETNVNVPVALFHLYRARAIRSLVTKVHWYE